MDVGGFEVERHEHRELRLPDAHLVRPAPPRVWTVFAAFVALWVGAMGTISVAVAFIAMMRTGGDAEAMRQALLQIATEPTFLLASSLTTSVWCAGIAALSVWAGERSASARLRVGPAATHTPLRLYLLLVLAALATSQLASSLIMVFGVEDIGTLSDLSRLVASMSSLHFAAAIVVLGVAAPIGEELFFRGFVQTRLTARWGATAGIVISALLFGLLHGDPVHSIAAFLMGLVLGWMVELTGSIRPAVTAHLVNNLVWVAFLNVPEGELAPGLHATIAAGSAAVAAVAFLLARRYVWR